MSELFYLTHTYALSLHSQELLKDKNLLVKHHSLVRYFENTHHNIEMGYPVIATSFAALRWLQPSFAKVLHLYCVGDQSVAFARELGYQGPIASCENTPSFLSLVLKNETFFKRNVSIWLGSAQGAWRHRAIFQQYPLMRACITHWNWPNYQGAYELSLQKPGTIICSSLAASLALRSQKWSQSWNLILSSQRLQPIVSDVFLDRKIRVSSWIQKILSDL